MSEAPATILPFALADRWIVTVESQRQLVKVRHRTRWYVVARRVGHDERRHWCASRADALGGVVRLTVGEDQFEGAVEEQSGWRKVHSIGAKAERGWRKSPGEVQPE